MKDTLKNLELTLNRFKIVKKTERDSVVKALLKIDKLKLIPNCKDDESVALFKMYEFFNNLNNAKHLRIRKTK